MSELNPTTTGPDGLPVPPHTDDDQPDLCGFGMACGTCNLRLMVGNEYVAENIGVKQMGRMWMIRSNCGHWTMSTNREPIVNEGLLA